MTLTGGIECGKIVEMAARVHARMVPELASFVRQGIAQLFPLAKAKSAWWITMGKEQEASGRGSGLNAEISGSTRSWKTPSRSSWLIIQCMDRPQLAQIRTRSRHVRVLEVGSSQPISGAVGKRRFHALKCTRDTDTRTYYTHTTFGHVATDDSKLQPPPPPHTRHIAPPPEPVHYVALY